MTSRFRDFYKSPAVQETKNLVLVIYGTNPLGKIYATYYYLRSQ